MACHKTENTLSVLGGALVGATAMYLLDPDSGRRRREAVLDSAGKALHNAESMAGEGWEHLAETAHELSDRARGLAGKAAEAGGAAAGTVGDYVQQWASQARDLGQQAAARASKAGRDAASAAGDTYDDYQDGASRIGAKLGQMGRQVADRARGLVDSAGESGQSAASSAGDWLGRTVNRARGVSEPSSPILPITLTGIGCIGLGVGLMYLLDPNRGRARRAYLVDQVTGVVTQTGKAFRSTGRHLRNQMRGVSAQTRTRFSGPADYVPGDQLLQRVRSELGHVSKNSRQIQVMTDSAGTVTLTGEVLARECQQLVAAVHRIPGVREVVNQLDLRDSMAEAGSDGGRAPQGQQVSQL